MSTKAKYEGNEKLYDTLIWSLASKGYTNAEIYEALNISERTFQRWIKKYPSFKEKFSEGRNLATAQVEEALFKRAVGYTTTEEETVVKFDKEGNNLPVNVKKKKKQIAPDTSAGIFWLKNRDSAHWKDKVEVESKGGSGLAESLVAQLGMVTEEELERRIKEKEGK